MLCPLGSIAYLVHRRTRQLCASHCIEIEFAFETRVREESIKEFDAAAEVESEQGEGPASLGCGSVHKEKYVGPTSIINPQSNLLKNVYRDATKPWVA